MKNPIRMTTDSFQNFMARLGYGTGNLSDGGTYQINYTSRNRWQLDAMYRSSWICGRAVDSVAEDMTKEGIEINSVIEPQNIEKMFELWRNLEVWDRIGDVIKWARLYGGALGVILLDGQELNTPLRIETVGKDQFRGILPLDRWLVNPPLTNLVQEYGPDFGLPVQYDVIQDAMAIPRQAIHYTRVVRIDGVNLPYWQRTSENLWGQSVIERLFDRLQAFDSTTLGAAQLVYKAHLRTYKVKGLRDIISAGGKILEGLLAQINFIRATQTNEGMTLMDAEDEFEAHQYSFAGLDTVLLQFSQQLSGAIEIPLVRLFGQSPAGLNSTGESDLRTYYDGIRMQQERRLRTPITKLMRITHRSLFGVDVPDGFGFTFRPLWQMSDLERAQIAASNTSAISMGLTTGMVDQQTALRELRQQSRITGMWSNVNDELIERGSDDLEMIGETENEELDSESGDDRPGRKAA